jgi:putative inorganic carbon (HCO3(-)) transporter
LKPVAVAIVRFEPLILAVLALPLLFPTPARSLALSGLPLLWIARRYASGHFVERTPLDWAILLLLIMMLVSLYATFDLEFSLPKLTGLLLGIAVYYATVAATPSLPRINAALVALLAMGGGVAALGLIGTRWLFKLPMLSAITQRLPSFILGLPGAESGFHPNEVAGTLIWFIPLQIALLIRTPRVRPTTWLLLAGSLALTGGTLLLTQSRSGWLGLAVALATLGAIVSRPLRAGVGLAVLISLTAVIIVGPTGVGEWLFGPQTQEATSTLNFSFRLQVWRAALWGAGDFAFSGMGLGTFRRVARSLYPLAVPADYDIAHAHNHFLQAANDLGLPGLVAYMALWLSAAYLLVKTYRTTEDDRWRALALGLGGGMLAYFVFGLTDAVALGAKPGVVFWLTLGLVVATYRFATADATSFETSDDQLAPGAL